MLEGSNGAYGEAVTPENTFDVILCLLSASTYTLRFAEDLEDIFPHVPFPEDLARLATQPQSTVSAVDYAASELVLCDDGSGLVTGIPNEVWTFSVSVLPDPEDIRKRLKALLSKARASGKMPWSERDARMWQTVFPNMAEWLPDEEAEQLRLEFAQEMERLKQAA